MIMEIPTGAIADVMGRRRAMICSFMSYIVAFIIFGFSQTTWTLFAAMFLFSIGEAFRTGTHKAIIFDWLEHEGRSDEKTHIYGLTRSWSKMGSALSAIIAAALVFVTGNYISIFFFCLIPYSMNIINFLTYPKYLDGPRSEHTGIMGVLRVLLAALKSSVKSSRLRRLLIESMGYEGLFKASKDYLQLILEAVALSLPIMIAYNDQKRTAVLVGAVYFVLYLLSSFASRHAGRFAALAGNEDKAARKLWVIDLLVFAMLGIGLWLGAWYAMIGAFVLLAILQNFWRPILISRFASEADKGQMATVLSIESQGKSMAAAAIAVVLGWSVDLVMKAMEHTELPISDDVRFMPIAALGVVISAIMLIPIGRKNPAKAEVNG